MTRYRVVVTPRAQKNLDEAVEFLAADSVDVAAKWLQEIKVRISSLASLPRRCAFAREQKYYKRELRQLIHKSHRIVFAINDEKRTVGVLFVLHGRRRTGREPREDE